ncbi:mCG1047723, partial [Mus musculus]
LGPPVELRLETLENLEGSCPLRVEGLGAHTPRACLSLPMSFKNQTQGLEVLELAVTQEAISSAQNSGLFGEKLLHLEAPSKNLLSGLMCNLYLP